MVGVVIATHGKLARELIATAEGIVGPMAGVAAVSMEASDGAGAVTEKIRGAMKTVDQGDGILILTDMFGGTPANVCLGWLEGGKVEVLTGVNLPMLLKLSTCRLQQNALRETARMLTAYGQKNVCLASDLLRMPETDGPVR